MLKKGFTLIELLVVISIIGLLAGTIVVTSQRGMEQSRDSRRIQELYQVAQSLQLYYTANGIYPDATDLNDPNCTIHGVVWDAGNLKLGNDDFIKPLIDENFMGNIETKEWLNITDAFGSDCIYRYAKVEDPCDGNCSGTYAILYAACESNDCPVNERPVCCDGSSWQEGTGDNDEKDITIFLKQN